MAVAPIKSSVSGTEDKGLLSADMVAKVLMLNVSRIHQMGREGIIPREAGGKYRLIPAVQGYIKFLKKDNEDEDLISLSKEKARLTKAQREKAEHELAVLRNQYVHVGEVESKFALFAKAVIGVLDTLSDRLERDADLHPGQVELVDRIIDDLRDDTFSAAVGSMATPENVQQESYDGDTEIDDSE